MNKEELLEEVKTMLKLKGKEHLLDFAEELCELAWDVVKVVVKKTETPMDDMVVAALDSMIDGLIDKVDGKEG